MPSPLHQAIANLATLIESRIPYPTVAHAVLANAEQVPNAIGYYQSADSSYATYQGLSWHDIHQRAMYMALYLQKHSIQKDDIVLIMARNRVEHMIADIAVLYLNAIPCSIYPTLSGDEVSYIAMTTQAKCCIVDHAAMFAAIRHAQQHNPTLQTVIALSDYAQAQPWVAWSDAIAEGQHLFNATRHQQLLTQIMQSQPNDTACLIFTSGTTGQPKGVRLTHHNCLYISTCIASILNIDQQPIQRGISYLPMAHVFERAANYYLGVAYRIPMYGVWQMTDLKLALPTVQPEIFYTVPRVLEKLHAGLRQRFQSLGKLAVLEKAVALGQSRQHYQRAGKRIPWHIRWRYWLYDRLIFTKIRQNLGLANHRMIACGSAPLNPDLIDFFESIGLNLVEGYGMTENTAVASCTLTTASQQHLMRMLADIGFTATPEELIHYPGSTGLPCPGSEIRLSKDGEILLRGPHICAGYFNDQAASDATIIDGWLHTGDLGQWSKHGHLHITGRIKDIIITAGGENIAPSKIEQLLTNHPLIGQACVVGDQQPYLICLMTFNRDGSEQNWLETHQLNALPADKIIREPAVLLALQDHLDSVNTRLSQAESIKYFLLLADDWTVDGGELTPTMKLKRAVILEKYQKHITESYHQHQRKSA